MLKIVQIGVKYQYDRDAVSTSVIAVRQVASTENRGDGLTKVLIGDDFKKVRKWTGVTARSVIEEGG